MVLAEAMGGNKRDQGSQSYEYYDSRTVKKYMFKLNVPSKTTLTQPVVRNGKSWAMQRRSANDSLREYVKKQLIIQKCIKRPTKYSSIKSWNRGSLAFKLPKGFIIGSYRSTVKSQKEVVRQKQIHVKWKDIFYCNCD
eukprot:TRINITY_DN22789_c0_g1_i2.p1 TRINITY_DN22789_c0_g1~~TRINITY_DN22789_c0_g1_i2.p1  ORF type:complete len:138 (-),score=21.04 TRINITY_DN22789_c0_g1_i2:102-515(-)